MNFSKQSQAYIKKLSIPSQIPVPKNKTMVKMLYKLIHEANAEVKDLQIEPRLSRIDTISDIPKPTGFNSKFLPEHIRMSINENSNNLLYYDHLLEKRQIRVNMIFDNDNIELNMAKYIDYIKTILLWLKIASHFSSNACSNRLSIYLYMTDFKKVLPRSKIEVIGVDNVNSGFSDICRRDSEIVIFRKEEWFKLLIHETFHNFGLEFSQMNISDFQNKIQGIFPINSELDLYEAWAESWALLINTGICAYKLLDDHKKESDFLLYYEFLILNEKKYTCFQVVKILDHMNLSYDMLIDVKMKDNVAQLYKEDTNVFAYYILKMLLIFNHIKFLGWCKKNNPHMIKFMQTQENLNSLYLFVKDIYKNNNMRRTIKRMEELYRKERSNKFKKTLKMSLCELI